MDDKKVWQRIYILIGVTVFLLIVMGAVWGFALNRPLLEKIATQTNNVEALKTQAAKLPDALKAKALAEEKKQYVKAQLYFFQNRYRHLVFDYGDAKDPKELPEFKEAKRRLTWQRWLDEYHTDFGDALRKELLRAADISGANISTNIKVSPPPKLPEEMPEKPAGFLKPISDKGGSLAVSITGTYPAIMNFFNVINSGNILMVVGNIRLEGSSPNIKATFPITPYLVEYGDPVAVQGAAPPPPPPRPVAPAPSAAASSGSSDSGDEVTVRRPRIGGSGGGGE